MYIIYINIKNIIECGLGAILNYTNIKEKRTTRVILQKQLVYYKFKSVFYNCVYAVGEFALFRFLRITVTLVGIVDVDGIRDAPRDKTIGVLQKFGAQQMIVDFECALGGEYLQIDHFPHNAYNR